MDSFDLRSAISRELQARERMRAADARKMPAPFRCLKHDDANASAWLGEHAHGCFTCGIEGESLYTLADALGIERPRGGLTVEEYAERKGFSVANLTRWGVQTATSEYGNDVVAIPYRDAEGKTLRRKMRPRSGKSFWEGKNLPIHPYGLDMLAKAKPNEPVILVEGESDCHAAWTHGVLAIGAPGAGTWKAEWSPLLAGREVYVWVEPDKGGTTFAKRIGESIPSAKVIAPDDVKDLAELHQRAESQFKESLRARMANAYPIGKAPPSVRFDAVLGPTLDTLLAEKRKPIDAVPTMLPTWNGACRDDGGGVGLARGWHVTIGARTGHGKSLIALNLASAAITHGERVAFVSLEMSPAQLVTRFLAIHSGVSIASLEKGKGFDTGSWNAASKMLHEVNSQTGGVLYINREPLSKITDVTDAIRYQAEVNGVRYVITDYMQLAAVEKVRDKVEAVEIVSHAIRGCARDLKVVSIGLSQLNRETSKEREQPPTPHGLLGGSTLENDSDQVLLLDHTKNERNRENSSAVTRLLLAKNRHGSLVPIDVRWDYRCLRLRELTADSTESVPEDDRGEAWEAPTDTEPRRVA